MSPPGHRSASAIVFDPERASIPGRRFDPYLVFLLAVTGMGGLLYGVDVGIIAAALPYMNGSVALDVAQTSAIVAAVLAGSTLASFGAGILAELLGRKTMMIAGGWLFVIGIGLIVTAGGYPALLAGRLLQGVSGGVIAMVIPLYIGECLPAAVRGRGTAVPPFWRPAGAGRAPFCPEPLAAAPGEPV